MAAQVPVRGVWGIPTPCRAPSGAVPRSAPRGAQEAKQLCEAFLCAGPGTAFPALSALRRELCVRRDPPVREVIDSGVPAALTAILQDHYTPAHVHYEATLVLAELCEVSGAEVAASGAAAALVALLGSPGLRQRPDLCCQTLATLGSLARDPSVKMRDHLLSLGVVEALAGLYEFMPQAPWGQAERLEVLRALTRLAERLCGGDPAPPAEEVDCLLEYFAQVLSVSEDVQMRSDAASGLQHLQRSSVVESAGGEHLQRQLLPARSPQESHGITPQVHELRTLPLHQLAEEEPTRCAGISHEALCYDENHPGGGNGGAPDEPRRRGKPPAIGLLQSSPSAPGGPLASPRNGGG